MPDAVATTARLPLTSEDATPTLAPRMQVDVDTPAAVAVAAWQATLAQERHSPHTRAAYGRDLALFAASTNQTTLGAIGRTDVADFLAGAASRATRKRRLTSLRRFYAWLIDDLEAPLADPTEGFTSQPVALRVPTALTANEQAAIFAAAASDRPWCTSAIWLMLRLGLTRSELLALRRDHIDLADPDAPVVYVFYDDAAKRGKERKLAADADFAASYLAYLAAESPVDVLFPYGPQAVNGMVGRVREAAGLAKEVTPQTLRHTFAVERARAGASAEDLIVLLGLADDPRNRASVGRYLKLAEPPL